MSTYYSSPYLLQNLAVSAYGYYYRKQNLNKHVLSNLRELEKTQFYSKSDLDNFQNKKLKFLIRHAYENVPYYHKIFRNNNLTPDDIKTKEDLIKVPYLTKDDIRNNFKDLIARNFDHNELQLVHTSGTTGSPLQFYWDKNVMIMENAFIRRHWRWAGFGFNDWRITLRGNEIVQSSQKDKPFWRYNYPEKQVFFSSFHLSSETISEYIKKIKAIRPKAIQGYPSAVSTIARYMLQNDIIIPIDCIFTSSEPIHQIDRQIIEDRFQCKIYDLYGLSERTVAAGQCFEGKYHLFSEYGIFELMSDEGIVTDDEFGEIVSTGLNNYGMPLIRYKTGDFTRIRNDSCDCGRNFPLMDPVSTRFDDMILTPDGRILPPAIVEGPIKKIMSIKKSQIIQEKLDKIVIKIVSEPEYSNENSLLLRDQLQVILGSAVDIEFMFVDEIPLTKGGKFKRVISKISRSSYNKVSLDNY